MARRHLTSHPGRSRWLWLLLMPVLSYVAVGLLAPDWLLSQAMRLDAWRSGAQRVELDIDGERWVLLQRGKIDPARPVWLFVHGFTGGKENWLPLLRDMPPDVPVLMPDLPGWGESERKPGAEYGYAAQAERVAALIDTLDLRQVRLVGHSMGGGIVALTAAHHPQRLRALILMSAAGVRFRDNTFGRAVLQGEHPFGVDSVAALDAYLGLVFEHPPTLPWPLKTAWVQQRIADDAFERAVLHSIAHGAEAFLPGESAVAITLPTLVMGCRNDPVIDASASEQYALRIEGARRVEFDACAHMPMMEQPKPVAAALLEFVGSLP